MDMAGGEGFWGFDSFGFGCYDVLEFGCFHGFCLGEVLL